MKSFPADAENSGAENSDDAIPAAPPKRSRFALWGLVGGGALLVVGLAGWAYFQWMTPPPLPPLAPLSTPLLPDYAPLPVAPVSQPATQATTESPAPVHKERSEPQPAPATAGPTTIAPTPPPPATPSEQPTSAPVTQEPLLPADVLAPDGRLIWRYGPSEFGSAGEFRAQGQGRWKQVLREKSEKSPDTLWREVRRSQRELELVTADGARRVCICDSYLTLQRPGNRWIRGPQGRWSTSWGTRPYLRHDYFEEGPPLVAGKAVNALEGNWANWSESGNFPKQGGSRFSTGWLEVNPRPDIVEFPWSMPREYSLDAAFIRHAGEGSLAFAISVDEHQAALLLDSYREQGFVSGLEEVGGHSLLDEANPTRHAGPVLETGKLHALHCEVGPGKIVATLDDRELFTWEGQAEQLSPPSQAQTKRARRFGLIARDGSFELTKLEFLPRVLHPPGAAKSTVGPAVELLQQFTIPSCLVRGEAGPADTADASPGWVLGSDQAPSTVYFPGPVPEAYALEVRLVKEQGDDGIAVALPMKGGRVIALLNAYPAQGGFGGIELNETLSDAKEHVKRVRLRRDRPYALRCIVAPGRVQLLLDGAPLADCSLMGPPPTQNDRWPMEHPSRVAVTCAQGVQYRILSLRLEPVALP